MATNTEIAARLHELARLTVLAEGSSNAFRVRAYETAARAIEGFGVPVTEMDRDALTSIRGVGKGTAAKIVEYLDTSTIAKLDDLRARFPPDFIELTKVPGVGPKTAVLLRDELGITDVAELRSALEEQRLRDLPGLGAKTEENIARSLDRLGIGGKDERRTPILDAMRIAAEVAVALREAPGVEVAEPMGSLRRFRETIGDVDVVVTSRSDPKAIMDRFVSLPVVADVVGYGARKSAIVSASGMQVDVRVVEPEQYGSAAMYFTGSKEHNIRLRQLAIDRGWTLSEYGLTDTETEEVIASATESEVYAALGMAWVPPELREDIGEVELALADDLPDLVEVDHLVGDLHVHTSLSGDGRDTLEDMVSAAAELGYRYVAITDHAEDLAINGASRRQMTAQRSRIARLQAEHPEMRILHGAELNIGRDGTVDYDAEFLAGFDFGVASVHSHFDLDRDAQTERVVRAMHDPAVNVIGHLTGRRIGRRPGIELDEDAVFKAAEVTRCAIEVNSHLDRLDAPSDVLRRAMGRDVLFAVSTDAHDVRELGNRVWGVKQARRGWVTRDRVVNTWERDRFMAWLEETRSFG